MKELKEIINLEKEEIKQKEKSLELAALIYNIEILKVKLIGRMSIEALSINYPSQIMLSYLAVNFATFSIIKNQL